MTVTERRIFQGSETCRTLETPRWPLYIGALAVDAWLARVAACETTCESASVELLIAQYPLEETEQAETEIRLDTFQLPLHLQWGNEAVPDDRHERSLAPDDAATMRRNHAFLTNTALSTTDADITHRQHAIIETTFANLIDSPLAHLPSGHFDANHAWALCAAWPAPSTPKPAAPPCAAT